MKREKKTATIWPAGKLNQIIAVLSVVKMIIWIIEHVVDIIT